MAEGNDAIDEFATFNGRGKSSGLWYRSVLPPQVPTSILLYHHHHQCHHLASTPDQTTPAIPAFQGITTSKY